MSIKHPASWNAGGSSLSPTSSVHRRTPAQFLKQEQRWVAHRWMPVSGGAGVSPPCSSRTRATFGLQRQEQGAYFSRSSPEHRWVLNCKPKSSTGDEQSYYRNEQFHRNGEDSHRRGLSGPEVVFLARWQPSGGNGLHDRRRFRYLVSRGEKGGVVGDYGSDGEGFLPGRGSGDGEQRRGGDFWGVLLEPISPVLPENPHSSLINEDFAPTLPEQRSFSVWDLASLWVGLVVGIPTYYMAGSLVEMGMAWWQGILTVLVGNVIVLVPMVLSGHGGTKYGIPFPVLSRAAFGVRGANIPSMLRALVGCGWFGIQTWIGGQAIFQLVNALLPRKLEAALIPWLGTSFPELACFLLFWTLQVGIIWNGIESIREMEKYCAPVLIGLSAALLGWAFFRAGGFGPMLSAPSQFVAGGAKEGQFWAAFFPALTANVGFWATLSLNIPDFTRYAHSQADQLLGQAVGLPLFMAAFTFVGLAVTSATVVIFGYVISDPIEVLTLIGSLLPTLLALVGVILATLTTNIAANVVAPANALVNINPSAFSFRKAGLLTATFSIMLGPWRLIQSSQGFIYTWLIGYSALLGPVGGIIITDYFLLRGRQLDISALYTLNPDGKYWYTGGFNLRAIAALVVGVLPNVPGFLHSARLVGTVPQAFSVIYDNSWFVGFLLSSVIYWFLCKESRKPVLSLG